MLKRYWWLLLLVLLSVPQLSFASEAAEPMYAVTESELTRLEQNLMELSEISSKQSVTLEMQKEQVMESDRQLQQAEEKYSLLSNQMKSLEQEMLEQQNSLENARIYFEEFAKEEQLKRDKLKREKTAAWIIAGVLCALVTK
ncbi:hypothetical protein I6E26_10305 [Anaerovibrio lipolyticus]|uniref:hypothetical protein n=1 Tax=Anaerovibrio lipolyticus TaxID=82374 RepID=UPI001F20D043|nr:hypothetical protein [Anaerovibrio lipolyticus]MCF2601924.1 hypothetical protein [Anaerovibrio lipolyticus]